MTWGWAYPEAICGSMGASQEAPSSRSTRQQQHLLSVRNTLRVLNLSYWTRRQSRSLPLLHLHFTPHSSLPVQFILLPAGWLARLFIIVVETVGIKTGAKTRLYCVKLFIHPSIPPNPSSSQFTTQSIVVSGFLRISSFNRLLSNC